MNQLSAEHVWPVLLTWTEFLPGCLDEQHEKLVLLLLIDTGDELAVQMVEFSDLVEQLASFELNRSST